MCSSRLGCDWLNGCLTFWHLGRNIHRGAFSAQPWRPLTGCFKACGRFTDRFVSSCANTLDVRHFLGRFSICMPDFWMFLQLRQRWPSKSAHGFVAIETATQRFAAYVAQTRFRSWMGSWPGFLAYSAQISVLPSRWISPCFEFVLKVLTLLPQLCIPALRCCWAILSRAGNGMRSGCTCSYISQVSKIPGEEPIWRSATNNFLSQQLVLGTHIRCVV